jgi:hypothetical protein
VAKSFPERRSQSLTEPLPESAEARRVPFGENAIDVTAPAWPSNKCKRFPDRVDQTITVRSSLPVASDFPSRETAMAETPPLWPR